MNMRDNIEYIKPPKPLVSHYYEPRARVDSEEQGVHSKVHISAV